jgi:hypothetical protein
MTDGYPLFDLLPNDQVVLYCATPDGDQQSVRSIVP